MGENVTCSGKETGLREAEGNEIETQYRHLIHGYHVSQEQSFMNVLIVAPQLS
jgi:hypothetical protein